MNITRENVDQLLNTGHIQVLMRSGKWWTIRRNGQTQRWKRDANRIRIPYKYGMYGYDAIDEHCFTSHGELDPASYRYNP